MWSYFGSKTNVVDYYPVPRYGKIIEPFAGTAKYSLKYFNRDIVLVDKYEVIVNIWKWLQQCSVEDIRRLPHKIKAGQHLDDLTFDCIEAKHLLGFLVGFATERPRKTATVDRTTRRPNHINYSLNRIEKDLFKIRHWTILHGSYADIPNQTATWFIDPPYQHGGDTYAENNKKINYEVLSEWCRSRQGQVICCENTRANWMEFVPMRTHKGSRGMQREAIWSNLPTEYDFQQQALFNEEHYVSQSA